MGTAVKKTISLPPKLAKEVEDISREERKPLSAVIHGALWLATHHCCLAPISCGFSC